MGSPCTLRSAGSILAAWTWWPGTCPSALRAFSAARADYELLAPGRLASLAVERARALLAAGLYTEADRELAYAAEQRGRAAAQPYIRRRGAGPRGGRPAGRPDRGREAMGAGGQGPVPRPRQRPPRRACLAARGSRRLHRHRRPARAIAVQAQALAGRLSRLGLPEDARVAALVAARALISAGQPARAARIVARYGPPGRFDRLDTRLLWRLARAELAAADGRPAEASRNLLAGMAALHRHRTQFGCLDLQTGAAVHGQDLARAGLAAALARQSPGAVYRWSERARAQALLLPAVRPPDDPGAAAALEELRQTRHALRARELAGQPVSGLHARAEVLQRRVREQSWATPGRRGAAAPAPTPMEMVRERLAGAALVIYLRDGPELRALVVAGDTVSLRRLGGYPAAAEAVLRLRADLDAQAGRALPSRLATAVQHGHQAGR